MLRKVLFAAIIVVALVALLTVSAEAWEDYQGDLQMIDRDEDSFWNYDFDSDYYDETKVDWPVNIVFYMDSYRHCERSDSNL